MNKDTTYEEWLAETGFTATPLTRRVFERDLGLYKQDEPDA